MIVVDTSALIAIVLEEPQAENCLTAITTESSLKISAATIAEALVVADGRKVGRAMRHLIDRFDFEIVTVTSSSAERVAESYRLWGKGNHPAGLNFGDCFAYALAKELACPLLFIGNDFARTDIMRA